MSWSELFSGVAFDLLCIAGILYVLVSLWRLSLAGLVRWRYCDDGARVTLLLKHLAMISSESDSVVNLKSVQKWSLNHWGFSGILMIGIGNILDSIRDPELNLYTVIIVAIPTVALTGFEAWFLVIRDLTVSLFASHGVNSLSELKTKVRSSCQQTTV